MKPDTPDEITVTDGPDKDPETGHEDPYKSLLEEFRELFRLMKKNESLLLTKEKEAKDRKERRRFLLMQQSLLTNFIIKCQNVLLQKLPSTTKSTNEYKTLMREVNEEIKGAHERREMIRDRLMNIYKERLYKPQSP